MNLYGLQKINYYHVAALAVLGPTLCVCVLAAAVAMTINKAGNVAHIIISRWHPNCVAQQHKTQQHRHTHTSRKTDEHFGECKYEYYIHLHMSEYLQYALCILAPISLQIALISWYIWYIRGVGILRMDVLCVRAHLTSSFSSYYYQRYYYCVCVWQQPSWPSRTG